jgi:hypothetical protein
MIREIFSIKLNLRVKIRNKYLKKQNNFFISISF